MYPGGSLDELAQRKALLQARIAVRRYELMIAGAQAAKPIVFIDRAVATWVKISPIVKDIGIPLGLLIWRNVRRKKGKGTKKTAGALKLATLLETVPLILTGLKVLSQVRSDAKNRAAF